MIKFLFELLACTLCFVGIPVILFFYAIAFGATP